MNTTTVQRQVSLAPNWVNVVLGIWVVISPFVLGFTQLQAAMWNNVAVGFAVILLALSRAGDSQAPAMLNVLVGIWLIVSPFVLGFSAPAPFWNNIILGIVIGLAALTASAQRPRGPVPPPAP